MTFDVKKQFSESALGIKPSPIREMFHMLRQPGMISFAGGMPAPEVFPVEEFAAGASILREQGRDILQYGTTEGYPPLMDFLCTWMAPRLGRVATRDEILITTGSSQVCDLLIRATVNRGDYVVTEEPTFLGNTINMYNQGAKFITVPCDGDGMIVDLLPEKLDAALAAGHKVKFIYTIPNFHNPSGATLSLERRKMLVEVAHKYDLIIMEDDPYGNVRFEGEDLPTIYSLDKEGHTLFAGSFSKILAPGTRVGWCIGPAALIRTMAVFKQGVDTSTSIVAQALVWKYCSSGALDAFLPKIIDNYRRKRDLMEAALRKYMPAGEAEWTTPHGGFFYWITTPHVNAAELFKKCVERKVAFVVGEPFYPNGGGEHSFRMCFTFATPEQMDTGIKALAEAVKELLPVKAE